MAAVVTATPIIPLPADAKPSWASSVALALLAILAFAGNSLLARAALGDGTSGPLIGPGAFTAIRLAAGALVLLPWFWHGARERPSAKGAAALFLYCAAFSFAYVQLNAATGAMLLFAAVQLTTIVVGLGQGNRLRAIDIAGIVMAMAGVAVLLGGRAAIGPWLAMLCMITAGVAWGLYSVFGRSAADPAQRTAGNFVLAALCALPLPLLDSGQTVSASGAGLALISGAVTSGLGYVLWYRLVPHLPHAAVGALQLATPMVAALAAAVLLGEAITLQLAAAALLILAGIAATLRPA